jgi:threonine/homoserine/homoserine lactone efflux protein
MGLLVLFEVLMMPDWPTIWIFAAASFALAVTPGPDMLLVAARSATQGRMAGLMTQVGISAGTLVHALILALGLSQLFLAVPYAYDAVRYLGAAYLIFLAWQAVKTPHDTTANSVSATNLSLPIIFRQGLITNFLNPKVALFFLALFPQFLDPEKGFIGLQVMVLATLFVAIDFAVHGVVIWMAGSLKSLARGGSKLKKYSGYFLGLVFTGLAARLVLDDRQ